MFGESREKHEAMKTSVAQSQMVRIMLSDTGTHNMHTQLHNYSHMHVHTDTHKSMYVHSSIMYVRIFFIIS